MSGQRRMTISGSPGYLRATLATMIRLYGDMPLGFVIESLSTTGGSVTYSEARSRPTAALADCPVRPLH